MSMLRRFAVLSMLAGAAFPAASRATLPVMREIRSTGVTTDTAISGFTASQRTIRQPGGGAFLSGLDFDEVGDKPCFIRAHWWRFNSDNTPQELATTFDICSSHVDGDRSILYADARQTKTGVRAIQVCNNSSNNHRLKGAKIFGATLDQNGNGSVVSTGDSRSFERTNCSPPWKTTRTCPAGQVAVGLLIEHTSEEITGLGLRCAPIEIVETTPTVASVYGEMEADIRVKTDSNGATTSLTLPQAITRHEVAGATVVVIEGGEVALVRHYGQRNAKDNLPTNGDTIYQAASISKLFGGLAMARAARLGVGPALDTTVQSFANAHPNGLIARWAQQKFNGNEASFPAEMDVRRLMGHTAGLSNHGIGNSDSDNATELETILMGDLFTDSTRPISRPGTEYCYSGGGVSAAEAMLQESGEMPRVFLNDMLDEWGLTKSTFNDANDNMGNLARGCSRGICSTDPKHTEAKFAGGMLANPEEYAQVLTYLMNNGRDPAGVRIIPLADVHAVLTPTFQRGSSLRACTLGGSACPAGETCIADLCRDASLPDCDGGQADYGLGTGISADDIENDGYPESFSHGGGNPDGDSATYFYANRAEEDGIVIMVNGEYEWNQNSVTYGADALVNDIKDAYFRHF